MISSLPHESQFDRRTAIKQCIEHATHYLPAQGPIAVFIHHNTLHAFEHMHFAEAVVEGAELFGCQPFLREDVYRNVLETGRITYEDLTHVLLDELGDCADSLLGFLGTRYHLRMAMLENPWHVASSPELKWFMAEADSFNRFWRNGSRKLKEVFVSDTRRWVTHDVLTGKTSDDPVQASLQKMVSELADQIGTESMADWSDDEWQSFSVQLLWRVCQSSVLEHLPSCAPRRKFIRHRDLLFAECGQDSDWLIQEPIVRFCSVFLDQGMARWNLPDSDSGFYQAFLQLYSRENGTSETWRASLSAECRALLNENTPALESIENSLVELGVPPDEWEKFIAATLLALRGWAGMIWQIETRGDRAVNPIPPGSLTEFLAIRLLLDRLALKWLAKDQAGYSGPLDRLRDFLRSKEANDDAESIDQLMFQVFQMAQYRGWSPGTLSRLSAMEWARLFDELRSFSSIDRRRVFHLAYERRFRQQTLDAISIHSQTLIDQRGLAKGPTSKSSSNVDYQVVCCIDEREESFRRHLEESAPNCETFGMAGFFAVVMYYRGAADAHFTPLCPIVVVPKHFVVERVSDFHFEKGNRRRQTRKAIGSAAHLIHVSSRSLIGGFLAGLVGAVATVPLVMRVLFPRLTARLRQSFGRFVQVPAATELCLQRSSAEPGDAPDQIGFTLTEMAGIVERTLRDIGLTKSLSQLVVIVGHGSSSLNNPHESAHDCGACGGGRGGPNARAFAQMANNPQVRELLNSRGLVIPSGTLFAGAYHNTCDDSILYFDIDSLATTHTEVFDRAKKALDRARELDAHERCRRFESAPHGMPPDAALRHVEARSEDLAQVRPEYGHATNAICIVGRRQRTRGLYLDRRAFLNSYDASQDDESQTILTRILQAVFPVCGGISLEYYFSFVDPSGYGCATKLPHNITSLLGVMDGAESDLRTGLPWQMVEIHEPVRLLFVIETTPAKLSRIIEANPGIQQLCKGEWVQVATLDPDSSQIHLLRHGKFIPHSLEATELPKATSSMDWYRGWRDHLGFAQIGNSFSSDQSMSMASDAAKSLPAF